MKRIAFYFDGTADTPETLTNVERMYHATVISADQVAFYDSGVGTDGLPLERLNGLAFGLGVFEKIKDAYTKIAHTYEKGDAIYLFGFSRGAFTARALAGMIADVGLPSDPIPPTLVDEAWEAYRHTEQRPALTSKYGMGLPQITMVGVFDTVAAVGLFGAPEGGADPLIAGFIDTQLHPCIQNAFQALAIDERRREFTPTPWLAGIPPLPGQVLEQVWFSGVHSDVGGGYPDGELALIPLAWMASKAAALGLEFDPLPVMPDARFALAPIHPSWNVFWLMPKHRVIPADAVIANSVAIRLDEDPSYRPENLIEKAGILSADYGSEQVVSPA